MTAIDPDKDSPSHNPRKTSKVLRWIIGVGFFCLVLLLLGGLLLSLWFPSDTVRRELEIRLSDSLQGIVTIESLAFNLFTGLAIHQVEFNQPGQPPLTLDRLRLDYSLLGLITGTLAINEVSLNGANISLNLPELSKDPAQEEPPTPTPSEPATLPAIPISIALDTLAITDTNIEVIVSPDFLVNLQQFNFRSVGALNKETAYLAGTLDVQELGLTFQNKQLQLPLGVAFDAHIDFPTQHLDLKYLSIESGSALQMFLSGTIKHFLSEQEIALSLHDTALNLELLRALLKDFIPPEFGAAVVRGTLSPALSLNGSLLDSQFQGAIQAGLQGKNLMAKLPSFGLDLSPTSLDIRTEDIRIHNNQPSGGTLSAKVSTQGLRFQSHTITNLNVVVTGDGQMRGPFSGGLNISGSTIVPLDIAGTAFTLPFDLTLDTKGNHRTREGHLKNFALNLGSYVSIKAKADLTPPTSQSPDMDASLELHIQPNLQALLPLIPEEQLQGVHINPSPGPVTFLVKATGSLQDDFQPTWATATAALKLSSIEMKSDTVAAEGTLNQLTFLLSSQYQKQHGAFRGTMGLATKVSDLHAKEALSLEGMNLILKSSFQGNLSPTFQPLQIRSHDQFQMTLRNIGFQDPSLTATLPSLKIFFNTKEDFIGQDYSVERFRIMSENLLDLRMKGRFTQATQQFNMNLHVPLFHIGNFLPILSGPLMKDMATINPQGRLGLTVQAAGRIPEKKDLEELKLPLGVKSQITLHDLAGAVAGYQIQGGNGTLSFAHSPNALPQTQLTTGIRIQKIAVPETLPISELVDTTVKINIKSPDLNEVQLDPIHVTSRGIDLSVKAGLVGLREFFSSSTPLSTQLAKLFVQLQTKLAVEIEEFQQVLEPFGLSGNGKAQVALSLHKQEQGDLKASLAIGTQELSLVQNETELNNMNGGLQVRKSLKWYTDNAQTTAHNPFLPSDRIAHLKRLSGKGQKITIDHVKLGPLDVEHLSANVAFQQQTFRIQNLAMNLLGGGIGGNMTIAIAHPLRISAGFEIANVDVNHLIKNTNRISGDSQIAATIALDTILREDTGAIDLSRLACQIDITHIGKEALDRLLVFLDPQGSNPTLSNARAQLKLANPSLVHIEVARGLLNLRIEFQGSLIPNFQLDRIPIAKMQQIEKLTAAIPNWESLIPLLDMIAAGTYRFSPEGELVLK